MSRPVYSRGTWIPGPEEEPLADSNPDSGLEQLINLAERQSSHRLNGHRIDQEHGTDQPQPTADDGSEPDSVTRTRAAQQPYLRTAWAGPVVVIVALGILGQAWIGYQGRIAGAPPSALWYLSLCMIFTPSAALVMSRGLSDQARIWLTLYMSVALLVTRFALYPSEFVYHDELINYRVLLAIDQHGHLFTPNSLLPATADYPGMEIAASAVHQLTGLSPHSAGMLILILVRVVMTLALIRVIERVSKKATVGCLAALIYATNPQYIFFNSQFAYQSVALPLCFFCVYVFTTPRNRRGLVGLAPSVAVVIAVAVTHHLTALALVLVLLIWYLYTRVTRRPVAKLLPMLTISIVIVAVRTWLARSLIVPYIGEIAHNSIMNIVNLADGKSNHRFFTDPAGDRNPAWQAVPSIASVLILTSALVPALWLAIIKRRLLSAAVMVLFTMAAVYPMIPAGHLTNATAEVADRASGFVFVGLGYLIGVWWFRDVPFHRHARTGRFTVARRTWLLVVGLTICFVGGAVIGSGPDWMHGPGPYLVSADNRSVDRLALQASQWEGRNLPPGSRVFADRVNGLLAAVYGDQNVLTSLGDGVSTASLSTLLLAPPIPADIYNACQANVQYLIADRRLTWSLPHVGVYIDRGEYPSGIRTVPPALSDLTKFDRISGAQRIFDNGAITIYNLRGLLCAGLR